MSHGDMNRATTPYWRSLRLRLLARRAASDLVGGLSGARFPKDTVSPGGRSEARALANTAWPSRRVTTQTTADLSSERGLLVDLRGDALQPGLEVRHVSRQVLVDECREQVRVRGPEGRDLLVAGMGVAEYVQEGLEIRIARKRR